MTPPAPRPSSTVLLLRDRPAGGIEVFLVRRHDATAFWGGAHVFPGGAVDPEDSDPALLARLDLSPGGQAADEGGPEARVAAIRETWEECGVLLVRGTLPSPPPRAGQEPLSSVLAAHDLRLAGDRLVYVARWVTPELRRIRYDARFYLAPAPPDQEPEHTATETTAGGWFTPDEALAARERREVRLAPPTLRNLELLARSASTEEALTRASSSPSPCVRPVMRLVGDRALVLLPGDPEYGEEVEPVLPGRTRFERRDGFWGYPD